MQATATRSSQRVAFRQSVAVPKVSRGLKVACNASLKEQTPKVAAALATIPTLLAASPAFALVDERLNGDGTGLPFGINDGSLGWVIFGVFALIWTVWFVSQKDLGDFEDPSSGLKL